MQPKLIRPDFVRLRDDLVQADLPSALRTISAAFGAAGELATPDR